MNGVFSNSHEEFEMIVRVHSVPVVLPARYWQTNVSEFV